MWLKIKKLISHNSRDWEVQGKLPTESGSGEDPDSQMIIAIASSHVWVSSYAINPIYKTPQSYLNHPKSLHHSLEGSEFNICFRDTSIQSITIKPP